MKKLDDILSRVESQKLCGDDYETIRTVIESYVDLFYMVGDKQTTIARLRKMLFGASTEKTAAVLGCGNSKADIPTACVDGQADSPASASTESTADVTAEHDCSPASKGHGRNGAEAYGGAEKIRVSHESLQAGDACPSCKQGTVYDTGRPGVLVRLVGQSPMQAKVYELQKLRCQLCGEIFTAPAPAGVGSEKYDATVGSMIALLKYGSGMPFNRLQGLQENLDIPLPASTQWEIVEAKAQQIAAAFAELVRQAADGQVVHNDDTTVKILELMGKRAQQAALQTDTGDDPAKKKPRQRSGMFTSGIVSIGAGRKIALFFSGRNHAGENLSRVLAQRAQELDAPIQMCDALSRNLPAELQTIVAHCLAHARRQFVEVAERFPEQCRYVLESLAVIYRNDALARERKLSPAARRHFHQTASGPTMKKLHVWLNRQFDQRLVEPNSSLGRAISYLLKHWQRLTLFLRVAGAPLDNNICERALKRAILHRKNALFYKTLHGAHVGDLFMSLIHTCTLCAANPFDYLTELERHADELAANPQAWMPWNYRGNLPSKGI